MSGSRSGCEPLRGQRSAASHPGFLSKFLTNFLGPADWCGGSGAGPGNWKELTFFFPFLGLARNQMNEVKLTSPKKMETKKGERHAQNFFVRSLSGPQKHRNKGTYCPDNLTKKYACCAHKLLFFFNFFCPGAGPQVNEMSSGPGRTKKWK